MFNQIQAETKTYQKIDSEYIYSVFETFLLAFLGSFICKIYLIFPIYFFIKKSLLFRLYHDC